MFYFEENNNGYSHAEPLKAKNLTAAKREASRKQVFQGTRLVLGDSLDGSYINHVISVKDRGGKWFDREYSRLVPYEAF